MGYDPTDLSVPSYQQTPHIDFDEEPQGEVTLVPRPPQHNVSVRIDLALVDRLRAHALIRRITLDEAVREIILDGLDAQIP